MDSSRSNKDTYYRQSSIWEYVDRNNDNPLIANEDENNDEREQDDDDRTSGDGTDDTDGLEAALLHERFLNRIHNHQNQEGVIQKEEKTLSIQENNQVDQSTDNENIEVAMEDDDSHNESVAHSQEEQSIKELRMKQQQGPINAKTINEMQILLGKMVYKNSLSIRRKRAIKRILSNAIPNAREKKRRWTEHKDRVYRRNYENKEEEGYETDESRAWQFDLHDECDDYISLLQRWIDLQRAEIREAENPLRNEDRNF